jgi:sRNA-binding regulator protein Hfq
MEEKKILPVFIDNLQKKKLRAKIYLQSGICLTGFVIEHGSDGILLGKAAGNVAETAVLYQAIGSVVEDT